MSSRDEKLQALTARLIDIVTATTGGPSGGGVLETSVGLLKGASSTSVESRRTVLKDQQAIVKSCPDISKFSKQYELLKKKGAPHLDAYVNLLARIAVSPSLLAVVTSEAGVSAPKVQEGSQKSRKTLLTSSATSTVTSLTRDPPAEVADTTTSKAKGSNAEATSIPSKPNTPRTQAQNPVSAPVSVSQKGAPREAPSRLAQPDKTGPKAGKDTISRQKKERDFRDTSRADKSEHKEERKAGRTVTREPVKDFQRPELKEGFSYPPTLDWKLERPFLTGPHLLKGHTKGSEKDSKAQGKVLGAYSVAVQELLLTNDLLFALAGIEGKYVRAQKGENDLVLFSIDETMDLSLQELAKRLLPMCDNYYAVAQFVESRSHFKYGLVSHALAAAIRALLQDYLILIAQLEHQLRLGRLSLQGLWFYCQPMIGALQVLNLLVQRATSEALYGAALLNLLQTQAQAMAGDVAARGLLQRLMQEASAPYFRILERWVYEGVIDDPYEEFLIQENTHVKKESLLADYNGGFWHQHYTLRAEVPAFLSTTASTILTTGKYLNAIRECGKAVQRPSAEKAGSLHSVPERIYLERINKAHAAASQELLDLLFQQEDLMGRLRSVKHYFLLDQGDFLVHFMDTANAELSKKPSQISLEKLQSLLELALRTSVCSSDPYHEDLTCGVERVALAPQIANVIRVADDDPTMRPVLDPAALAQAQEASTAGRTVLPVTGLETFTLDFRVKWPCSLVISRKALTKYAFIFRHMFHCKHVERQLSSTWQAHQATRGLDLLRTSFGMSFFLCQRMLAFILTFEHYMTFEVLEAQWSLMEGKLKAAKSVDEVIEHHDEFLDRCLRECMIFWPKILRRVERLKATCLDFTSSTQWLVQSVIPDDIDVVHWSRDSSTPLSQSSPHPLAPEKYAALRHKRAQARELAKAHAQRAAEDPNSVARIKALEDQFNNQLKDLIALLTSCSQTDPYLAHLAQRLQSVGQGFAAADERSFLQSYK